MPFTASHAVVALPFLRSPLVPAAIAVGAMTPDLPLFVRGTGLTYGRTHDLAWLPLTTAVALVLLLLWRVLLRPAVRDLAPRIVAERLPPSWDDGPAAGLRETFGVTGSPARASLRTVLLLVISLGLGVVTHIVWDLFTHEGRWGSTLFPVLDAAWGPFPGYKWLQHASSVVGLAIIAVWAVLWLRRRRAAPLTPVVPGALRIVWWVSLPLTLIVAWTWGLWAFGPFSVQWTPAHLAYRVLPPACAVWAALTAMLCGGIALARSRRGRRR